MKWLLAGLALVLLLPTLALAADPVAAVTELRGRRGDVEVKAADGTDWSGAKPLQSLRAGDQVRAAGDGRAVLLFTGGRGTAVVTASNSPFTVVAPSAASVGDRARSVVGDVTAFLLRQQRERTYQSLSTRSVRAPTPVILAPRNTRVAADGLVFEWLGSDRLRYRVRLIGPQGVMWEQGELERNPVTYPASAPPLAPGATYVWELETREHGRQIARFEVAPAADATTVREALAVLTPETARDYPPATLAVMRAGALFQERFYADAWRELTRGLATAPEEPALHLMLGYVYDRIGLRDLAGRSFGDAAAFAGP